MHGGGFTLDDRLADAKQRDMSGRTTRTTFAPIRSSTRTLSLHRPRDLRLECDAMICDSDGQVREALRAEAARR